MDKRELEYFIAIAEEENISAAAQKLNVAQPHLSRQLKQLEEELGVELFERKKKRLHLTNAGRFLLNRGYEITRLMDQTVGEMRQIINPVKSSLSLGALESVSISFLPGWLAEFRGQHPEITIQLRSTGTSVELLEWLNKGLLEVAFVKEPVSTALYQYLELEAEPWVAVFPKDHPLGQRQGPVEQSELAGVPLLVTANNLQTGSLVRWLNLHGVTPWISGTWTTLTSAAFLMKAGGDILICPASGLQLIDSNNFSWRRICFSNEDYRWVMLWNRFGSCSPNAQAFLEFVHSKLSHDGS